MGKFLSYGKIEGFEKNTKITIPQEFLKSYPKSSFEIITPENFEEKVHHQ